MNVASPELFPSGPVAIEVKCEFNMVDKVAFTKRILSLQWAVLLINIAIIAVGGSNFGLAVASRPILRLSVASHYDQIRSICDLIVATGIVQIVVAGYDIFASNWKLIRPLYLAITLACAAVIIEIVAITTCSYIYTESDAIVDENIFIPWYEWDCLPSGSCKAGVTFYTAYFLMPQVGLTALAIALHCLAVLYLLKLLRTLQEKQQQILIAKEKIRQAGNSRVALTSAMETAKSESKDNPEDGDDDDEDENGNEPSTPASILKGDHGYVAAGSALDKDYDDAKVIRNRGKQPQPQSLSFNTNVEIHFLNQKQDNEEGHNRETTQM
ncbi:unnamed protein product [Allacma fusca]|uniref:Uncharacterized protein n=1 Tax=Allacma fusca TaxID=39272 RepID=A0A8J2PI39_9HEXA|nr:unnamed protein product [Allacma fusca]